MTTKQSDENQRRTMPREKIEEKGHVSKESRIG